MKAKWSTRKKIIKELLESAKLRGDDEAVERWQKKFDEEVCVTLISSYCLCVYFLSNQITSASTSP